MLVYQRVRIDMVQKIAMSEDPSPWLATGAAIWIGRLCHPALALPRFGSNRVLTVVICGRSTLDGYRHDIENMH